MYSHPSYSQEGEDLILLKFFKGKKNGFYVDIGAHHPYRYSNTYLLYKLGWYGINIDATPGSMEAFKKTRHRDINLEMAIGRSKEKNILYQFADPALNTLSLSVANEVINSNQSILIKKTEIKTHTLKSVLDKYLPKGVGIDLLNIDTEGLDYEILLSNDWRKYPAKIVTIEITNFESLLKTSKSNSSVFLSKEGYQIFARTLNTVFFRKFTLV